MRFVVIDDTLAELTRAIETVTSAGHEVVALSASVDGLRRIIKQLDTVEQIDGIITDLYWEALESSDLEHQRRYWRNNDMPIPPTPPSGLLVALWAASKNIPVVICTDADHHGPAGSWICDALGLNGFLPIVPRLRYCDTIRAGTKDWSRALNAAVHMAS